MKAYQAYGKAGRVTSEKSPRDAAAAYFENFPKSTKCNVVSGETDGHFFTVKYGRYTTGEWPESYKDVTKKTIQNLRG
jgi:hypothetical protein